jgi:single-strand DNA-binding protein
VATFGLAINHRYRQGEDLKEETCFVDCVAFGRQAETIGEYLQKGAPALVEGRLRWRSWDTEDRQRHSKYEILAERVQFLPSSASVREGGRDTAEVSEAFPYDETDVPF